MLFKNIDVYHNAGYISQGFNIFEKKFEEATYLC